MSQPFPKYTPKEIQSRYIRELYRLLKVARRIGKQSVIWALRQLIDKQRGRE